MNPAKLIFDVNESRISHYQLGISKTKIRTHALDGYRVNPVSVGRLGAYFDRVISLAQALHFPWPPLV